MTCDARQRRVRVASSTSDCRTCVGDGEVADFTYVADPRTLSIYIRKNTALALAHQLDNSPQLKSAISFYFYKMLLKIMSHHRAITDFNCEYSS